MKCPNCGSEIAEGSKFCINCGAAIPSSQDSDAAASQPADEAAQPTQPMPGPGSQPTQPMPGPGAQQVPPAPGMNGQPSGASFSPSSQQAPAPGSQPMPGAGAQPTQPMPGAGAQPTQPMPGAGAPGQVPQQPGQIPQPGQPGQPGQIPQPGQPGQPGQYPGASQYGQPQGTVPMGAAPQQPAKKSHTGLIIGIIAAVVVIILIVIGVRSCSKLVDDAVQTSGSTTTTTQAQSPIVGSWESESISLDDVTVAVDPSEDDPLFYMSLVFNDDGTGSVYMYSSGASDSADFTYEFDGSTITLTDEFGDTLSSTDAMLSYENGKVVLSSDLGGDDLLITFESVSDTTASSHRNDLEMLSTQSNSDPDAILGQSQEVAAITGDWDIDTVKYDGYEVTASDYRSMTGDTSFDMMLSFYSDGTGFVYSAIDGESDSVMFTYTFDGTNILITDVGATSPESDFTLTYDPSAEQLVMVDTADSFTIIFSRVDATPSGTTSA